MEKDKITGKWVFWPGLVLTDSILVNAGFLLGYLVRYGLDVPSRNIEPYQRNFWLITLIFVGMWAIAGVYRSRFASSWQLFKRVCSGTALAILVSVSIVYVFRVRWGAFPASIFLLGGGFSLLFVFKLNQKLLKRLDRIFKRAVIFGQGGVDAVVDGRMRTERRSGANIEQLLKYKELDEVIISEHITEERVLNVLSYLVQNRGVSVIFTPVVYMKLLPNRIDGRDSMEYLQTFIGKRNEAEEFLMRVLDVVGAAVIFVVMLPVMGVLSLLVKLSSPGPVFYSQTRVGKDGRNFTLYKFRTMVQDAEKLAGFEPAGREDKRVTTIGRWLRRSRLDELPQLVNVIKGQMSLVGPRPENLYRVRLHKALRQLRLSIRPGITGLAQVRSFYDLHPRHKIKYDYLYIQRRSLLLNLYILARTIPVLVTKKGW